MTAKSGRPKNAAHPLAPPPEVVRATRAAVNLSQEEAAFIAGVSARTWYRWETGLIAADPSLWFPFLKAVQQPDLSPPPAPPSTLEIMRARARRKLSAEQSAKLAKVSVDTWAAWEMGRKPMPAESWREWLKTEFQGS